MIIEAPFFFGLMGLGIPAFLFFFLSFVSPSPSNFPPLPLIHFGIRSFGEKKICFF